MNGAAIAATASIVLAALLGSGLGAVAWAQGAEADNAAVKADALPASTVMRPGAVPDTAPPSGLVAVPEVTPGVTSGT
ncbi:MAG: hypothetical protein ACREQN_06785, partial [Candidatus Binataceae bacterium]